MNEHARDDARLHAEIAALWARLERIASEIDERGPSPQAVEGRRSSDPALDDDELDGPASG